MAQEAQHVVLAGVEAEQQVVAGAARCAAPSPPVVVGDRERRLGLMESQAVGDNGLEPSSDQSDQGGFQRDIAVTGPMGGMADPAQQLLHPTRPWFLLDLDQSLKFAQMVGVA